MPRCLFLSILLAFLPFASYGRVTKAASTPTDAPSGFLPGVINYFAGNGTLGATYSDGSLPTLVQIQPLFTAADSAGNIYLATAEQIYVVYSGGKIPAALANVTTNASPSVAPQAGRIYQVAGLSTGVCGDGSDPTCGEGLPLNQVLIAGISGFTIDKQDNLYYSDDVSTEGTSAQVVRKIAATSSIVTTVAGQLGVGSSSTEIGDGGPATGPNATLYYPTDIKIDAYGNLFINDFLDDVIRVVYSGTTPPPLLAAEGVTATPGYIYTVAGQVFGYCTTVGGCGDGTSATTSAILANQESIAIDGDGNLYIADTFPGLSAAYIRVVYAGGTVPPLLSLALNPSGGGAASPTGGYIYAATGYGPSTQYASCVTAPCGDGGLAADVQFGYSISAQQTTLFLTLDSIGNLYVSDEYAFAVREIDTSGYASTIAGIDDPNQTPPPVVPPPAGGPAASTQLSGPISIAFDAQDDPAATHNLYIVDTDLVWIVTPVLPQTIDFPALPTVTYGASPITLAATASSGLAVTYAVTSGPGKISGSQLVVTGAGTIAVTASQPGNADYTAATPVSESVTVNQAMLAVTANDASKIFGSANPAFSATISGFVNGETQTTPGVYSGLPAFATTATTTSPQGVYPVTVSLGTLTSNNYSFDTFIPGTLTITGSEPQAITFPQPPPITYGATPTVTLTATASSGLPVTFQVVSGPGELASNVLTITGGGTIVITASQQGAGPYKAATPVTDTLVVKPAPLTVTGPTITLSYGTAVDATKFPAATISGFVGTDTQSSIVTGSAAYTTVSGTPDVGTYPITVGLGTLTLVPGATASYTFVPPINGSLVITSAVQTINLNPVPAGQIYGDFVSLTAVATSGMPVTFTETGPAYFYNGINVASATAPTVQLVLTGVSAVTVTATQAGNSNYSPAPPISETFSVGPAPLNIGVAQIYVREQDAPNPVFQPVIGAPSGQPGSFVNGDADVPAVITGVPLLSTAATPSSPPGNYPIVPSQGTLAAPNYYFVYVNGQLTVTPPGAFTMTASPSSLTIGGGLTGQSTLTITPVNVYQGTITLSCGQVPVNVTCIVSPSTYVFPGAQTVTGTENSAQGTITITASGGTVVGATPRDDSRITATILLIPAVFSGLLIAFSRKQAARRSRIWGGIALLVLSAAMAGISSCGGSSKMTTAAPGTTTIMITGSGTTVTGDGAVSASAPLSVTIQ